MQLGWLLAAVSGMRRASYATAALYPGINEAKGSSAARLLCFIYCIHKCLFTLFRPEAQRCVKLKWSWNPQEYMVCR